MKTIKEMSNEELLNEYKQLDELVHGPNPCYSSTDLFWLNAIEREMTLREEGQ